MDPASHISVDEKPNAAEHLLLNKRDFAKFLPNPLCELFIESHKVSSYPVPN
jgi:hypothetical protein